MNAASILGPLAEQKKPLNPTIAPAANRPPLAIITPVSRPENLAFVASSIAPHAHLFDISWHVVFDLAAVSNPQIDRAELAARATGYNELPFRDRYYSVLDRASNVGNFQRNFALELIDDGWVYFLDDDNLLHPDLLPAMRRAIDETNARGFVFSQIGGQVPTTAHPAPEFMRPNHVDLAQIFLSRSLIASHRLEPLKAYNADGRFIAAVYSSAPSEFAFIPRPLCFYNALRPKEAARVH